MSGNDSKEDKPTRVRVLKFYKEACANLERTAKSLYPQIELLHERLTDYESKAGPPNKRPSEEDRALYVAQKRIYNAFTSEMLNIHLELGKLYLSTRCHFHAYCHYIAQHPHPLSEDETTTEAEHKRYSGGTLPKTYAGVASKQRQV